jgi:hypothetical protein
MFFFPLKFMIKLLHGPNKKRTAPMFVVGKIDVQQKMSGALFKGYIVSSMYFMMLWAMILNICTMLLLMH